MSGHSKWAQIKHKKGVTDQKRGVLFSKLLAAISAAAKNEQNPEFNPRLRAAIDKAKVSQVPQDNIERAVKKAKENSDLLEELILEAYGPGGAAVLITAITNNRNRTVSEIKHLLSENNGKWAEPGSVSWAFESKIGAESVEWQPKYPQHVNLEDQKGLLSLLDALDDHPDTQEVFVNVEFENI